MGIIWSIICYENGLLLGHNARRNYGMLVDNDMAAVRGG